MVLIFKEDRDREFFDLCMKIKQGTNLSVEEVVFKAVNSSASSFFITNKGYERIISYTGEIKGIKRELYKEIKLRYSKICAKSVKEACIILECQTAPRFYMSQARAVSLYYELIKKYNNEVHHRINFYNRVFGV